jgi:hypothetical protein
MQNLSVPSQPLWEISYLRQHNANIFSINDFRFGKAKYYSYHDKEGWKNPNEVSSCILSCIDVGFVVDKVALDSFFSHHFQLPPSVSFHTWSILIHSSQTLYELGN